MKNHTVRCSAALALVLSTLSPAIGVAQDSAQAKLAKAVASTQYTVLLNAAMGDVGSFRGRVGVAVFSEKNQVWSAYKTVEGLLSMEVRAVGFDLGPDFGPVTKVRVWSENGIPLNVLGQASTSSGKVKSW